MRRPRLDPATALVAVIAAGLVVGWGTWRLAGGRADPPCDDIAAEVGLDFENPYGPVTASEHLGVIMQRNMGNGAAVGDYDGDGDLDLYLLSNAGHPARLFRNELVSGEAGGGQPMGAEPGGGNRGDGELWFEDVTEAAGVADRGLGRVAHFADLDGDGDLDLLVMNDHDPDGVLPPSRLFENRGDGTFADVSASAGLQPVGYLVGGTALADHDGDGDLDVLVSMWTRERGGSAVDVEPEGAWPGANTLYENRGDLRFVDVTGAAGLDPVRLDSFTAAMVDFDLDGDLDLYQAVDHREDRYHEQDRPGHYVDAAGPALVNHVGNDMGIAAGDVTGDGLVDLFVTNISDPQQSFGTRPAGNTLLVSERRDDGGVRFRDRAAERGVEDVGWGWGTVLTDADLDGDLDLFAVQGFDEYVGPNFELYDRTSVLFRNDGTGRFVPWPDDRCRFPGDQRALISFDADRDHDPDWLVTQVDGPPLLIRNGATERGGRGATIALSGPPGAAAGAIVEAVTSAGTSTQVVLAGGSYLSGPPREAYIGLGGDEAAEVTVRWADGTTTELGPVSAGTRVEARP